MLTLVIIVAILISPLLIALMLNRVAKLTFIDPSMAAVFGVSLVFCFTGAGHFIKTESMAEMLPGWVPARISLVYLTGIIELLGAVLVLVPRFRRAIGWCLILMLLLFLPVNIYAAVNHVEMGGHAWGPIYLWVRIPLQLFLVAWIWRFVARDRDTGRT